MTMLFRYLNYDIHGTRVCGHVWSKDETTAINQLRQVGLEIIRLQWIASLRRKYSLEILVDFFSFMEWMLEAGIPLHEALQALSLSPNMGKPQRIAAEIIVYLESGLLWSQAMAFFPRIFTPLMVHYIAVGEQSGQLRERIASLLISLRKQLKTQRALGRALSYPLLTLITALSAIAYLVFVVVPDLVAILPDVSTAHSLHGLLKIRAGLASYGWAVLCIGMMLWGSMRYVPLLRQYWDHIVLYVPGIGLLIRYVALARMLETIAHLYSAGLGLLECLAVAQDLTPNQYLRQHMVSTAQAVNAGKSLAQSFATSTLFPTMLIQTLHLAEKSGKVVNALCHTAQFFQGQADNRMRQI
jgi:type II secretory pathway component PulF